MIEKKTSVQIWNELKKMSDSGLLDSIKQNEKLSIEWVKVEDEITWLKELYEHIGLSTDKRIEELIEEHIKELK